MTPPLRWDQLIVAGATLPAAAFVLIYGVNWLAFKKTISLARKVWILMDAKQRLLRNLADANKKILDLTVLLAASNAEPKIDADVEAAEATLEATLGVDANGNSVTPATPAMPA